MQRWAMSGLLGICVLLAAGLGLTAYFNYRAAQRAAQDVLFSRAAEISASFLSTARWTGALFDEERLTQLASELAVEGASIAVLDAQGLVLAAGGRSGQAVQVGQRLPASLGLLQELRLSGQVQRLVAGSHLEHWRVMGAHGPGMGLGRRLRWLLERGQSAPLPPAPGKGPGAVDGQPPMPGPPGAGWPPGRGPRFRLLRVTVPVEAARSLTEPAQLIVTLAGVISVALVGLGLLLYRAARRAQVALDELQRRRALSALGEMAAVLAHEIRTPLASIKGNAQLLGEGLPEDERAVSIVTEAGRLERLVNGLLDYARPREPRRVPCDPDQLVERAAQIVAPQAAAAGVDLISDPCGCGACLQADPDQLLQVLVNLLQNAVEASSAPGRPAAGPVVVRVRRGGGRLTFSVLDCGPGLPPGAPVEQLFRPFFSTKKQGTGLGLAVARQIALQHGGELLLEPRKEGGVAASLRLPEGGK